MNIISQQYGEVFATMSVDSKVFWFWLRFMLGTAGASAIGSSFVVTARNSDCEL